MSPNIKHFRPRGDLGQKLGQRPQGGTKLAFAAAASTTALEFCGTCPPCISCCHGQAFLHRQMWRASLHRWWRINKPGVAGAKRANCGKGYCNRPMTRTPTPEQLKKVIREGSPADSIAFLAQYDVAARRLLSDVAVALFTEDLEAYFKSPSRAALHKPDAARAAVLATGSLEQVIACDWHVIPDPELLIEVFDTFQPAWTNAWVQHVLDENPYMIRHLHWLWDADLCKRPSSVSFIHGLLATHVFLHWPVETSALRAKPARSDQRLVTTPAKQAELINDFWRFFEVKGRGEFSLGYLDLGSAWRARFIELCDNGQMPRDRLLDASLAALTRDFNQAETRCFARLYWDLEPTAEEQHARCDRLLALIGAELPSTVSFAVKAVKQVNKDYPVPAANLIEALKPAFVSPGKGTVIEAIRLAKDAVKRSPDTRMAAIDGIVQGLQHKSKGVPEASLAILETWSTDFSSEALQKLRDTVSALPPTLRARAQALCSTIPGGTDPSIR